MEHVLHVSSIASVIGRCLRLNTDLISAIAKAHDLGHPPFGHAGEKVLDTVLRERGVEKGFKHEMHGLRVVDVLTNYGDGLNLTYEVRDGIVTHCGESFERVINPDRSRDLIKLETIDDRTAYPGTLEGCLVRMVDRIAYLGRDLEDGIKAGLVKKSDVPKEVALGLGTENGKIIGMFVNDVITHSIENDAVIMSEDTFGFMKQLKEFNYGLIYGHPNIRRKERKVEHIVRALFDEVYLVLEQSSVGKDVAYAASRIKDAPSLSILFDFIKNTNYTESTPIWRMTADYIAGMTDAFAQRTFGQLFTPTPVV
jgi:dGTPase